MSKKRHFSQTHTYTNTAQLEHDHVCCHCGSTFPKHAVGTRHRNHCPICLWSQHLDIEPGDRKSTCKSPMKPIAVSLRENGEWMIVHQCTGCGAVRVNRIAGDDQEFALLSLAAKPLSQPPFPLVNVVMQE